MSIVRAQPHREVRDMTRKRERVLVLGFSIQVGAYAGPDGKRISVKVEDLAERDRHASLTMTPEQADVLATLLRAKVGE